jgi:hypothetical protein
MVVISFVFFSRCIFGIADNANDDEPMSDEPIEDVEAARVLNEREEELQYMQSLNEPVELIEMNDSNRIIESNENIPPVPASSKDERQYDKDDMKSNTDMGNKINDTKWKSGTISAVILNILYIDSNLSK